MSAHEKDMSALISLSGWMETTRGYPITTRANKTTLCAFQPQLSMQQAEAAKLDAAIEANLKELGYGE